MNIGQEIMKTYGDDLESVRVNKNVELNGEDATEVEAVFKNGTVLTGTFTTNDKKAFGGVEFSQQKDIPGLMKSKIQAIKDGKAETR